MPPRTASVTHQRYVLSTDTCNADALYQKLAAVKRWSAAKGVPVFVGEFGSYDAIDPANRGRPAKAVSTAMATLRLPGAWWEWSGNFGLVPNNKPIPGLLDAQRVFRSGR